MNYTWTVRSGTPTLSPNQVRVLLTNSSNDKHANKTAKTWQMIGTASTAPPEKASNTPLWVLKQSYLWCHCLELACKVCNMRSLLYHSQIRIVDSTLLIQWPQYELYDTRLWFRENRGQRLMKWNDRAKVIHIESRTQQNYIAKISYDGGKKRKQNWFTYFLFMRRFPIVQIS